MAGRDGTSGDNKDYKMVPVTDSKGNPVLDGRGNPVMSRKFLTKAEKAAMKNGGEKATATTRPSAQTAPKPKAKKQDLASMASAAIDRSSSSGPKTRPTRNRSADKAPTATSVSTPEVTTEKLPARRAGTAERPSGPKGPSPLAASETSEPRGTKPFAGTKPTREEWENMSVAQRIRWGVVTPPRRKGGERSNSGTTAGRRDRRKESRGMAMGGMVGKSGYAKGGMVKANCGASMKPTQKSTKGK